MPRSNCHDEASNNDLLSKGFEIISLVAIICSVYLLSVEVQRYSEATNIATYQKLTADMTDLHFEMATNAEIRTMLSQFRVNGPDSLSSEMEPVFDAVNMSLLRITEVAFKALRQNILADDEITRFMMPACLGFSNMSKIDRLGIVRQSTTENYFLHLQANCETQPRLQSTYE